MSRFEQIQVGDTADVKHVITQKDVTKFVDLTGDDPRGGGAQIQASLMRIAK